MTTTDLLKSVKMSLGITGDYQDETLKQYINEVRDFLKEAGASDDVMNSSAITGVVTRGVSDLWNYGSGGASLSPYFVQRAIQLLSK